MVNLHIFVWFAISLNSIKKIICEMLDDISSHKPIEIILVLSIDLERIKGAIVIRIRSLIQLRKRLSVFTRLVTLH